MIRTGGSARKDHDPRRRGPREGGIPEPVPESDPQHIDPAGDLADAVESGDLDLSLTDDQDAEEIRAFVEAAESGELGPIDPGLEPQVRIARALFNDLGGSDDAGEGA